MCFDTTLKFHQNRQIFQLYHLATCASGCTNGGTYDGSTTCGLTCNAGSSFSIGSTGTCGANSTYCAGGTYTIVRNSYSSVNFDCANCCGCSPYGGCCTNIGPPSAPNIFCITCT
jgi:hypothetical protein